MAAGDGPMYSSFKGRENCPHGWRGLSHPVVRAGWLVVFVAKALAPEVSVGQAWHHPNTSSMPTKRLVVVKTETSCFTSASTL